MEIMFKESETLYSEEFLLRSIPASKRLVIGIPKENQSIETRLALTPEGVEILTEVGHEVLLQSGAGQAIGYSDLSYAEAGAIIVNDAASAFAADIVLKIAPPTPQEISLMNDRAALFSLLQLSLLSRESVRLMMQKKINAVAYELIKDKQRKFPVLNSLSEIEGIAAVSIASQYMSSDNGGKGLLLGGIAGVSATEVIILGAGIAGISAARTAMALGAQVKIFDHDINKLRKLQQLLGQHVFTSVIHPKVLFKALLSADAVIGMLKYINGSERFMIAEDLVRTMKKGAVIVDLSVDQHGCFETSECRPLSNPAFEKHGVIHYCVPNLSSRVGRTASMALSNIFTPLMLKIAATGSVKKAAHNDFGIRNGLYIYNGILVNPLIGKHLNIPANDIGLFMAGF
ncbi:MAG: alanine dehydrogenase [Prevotellaceae bacterium]|jgi:alanine dehydrogenase|nr:alanine dehydrogenase [Prevotellaceae bacterium]